MRLKIKSLYIAFKFFIKKDVWLFSYIPDWWQSRKLQKEAIHIEEIVINLNRRNLFKIALF